MESNPRLQTLFCDSSWKLAPLSRPIRCKTQSNYCLVGCVLTRFRQFGCFYLIGSWRSRSSIAYHFYFYHRSILNTTHRCGVINIIIYYDFITKIRNEDKLSMLASEQWWIGRSSSGIQIRLPEFSSR